MNQDDKKYIKATEKMRPSSEVFVKMVEILANTQKKSDKLVTTLNNFLLETFKTS